MPKILVLYHSTYGHIEKMAEAVAEGARSVEGAVVDIKRVPELVPEELARGPRQIGGRRVVEPGDARLQTLQCDLGQGGRLGRAGGTDRGAGVHAVIECAVVACMA